MTFAIRQPNALYQNLLKDKYSQEVYIAEARK